MKMHKYYFLLLAVIFLIAGCKKISMMPDGTHREFYSTGALKERSTYVKGKRNGSTIEYYSTGEVRRETYYKNGLKEGEFKEYYIAGPVKTSGFYKNDKIEGKLNTYYPNEAIKGVLRYSEGLPEGLYEQISP